MRLQPWLVAVIAAATSIALLSPAAGAEEATIVFQANLRIPIVGTTALGTLTTTVDEDTGEGTWFFQGTINGQFATASGAGIYTIDGSTINLSMTSIDSWQMPGLAPPPLPAEASVRSLGNLAYVSYGPAVGVPVSISPSIDVPIQSGTYVLTDAGKGADGVEVLPKTGVAPMEPSSPVSSILPTSLIAGALIFLIIALPVVGASLWGRGHRRTQTSVTAVETFVTQN